LLNKKRVRRASVRIFTDFFCTRILHTTRSTPVQVLRCAHALPIGSGRAGNLDRYQHDVMLGTVGRLFQRRWTIGSRGIDVHFRWMDSDASLPGYWAEELLFRPPVPSARRTCRSAWRQAPCMVRRASLPQTPTLPGTTGWCWRGIYRFLAPVATAIDAAPLPFHLLLQRLRRDAGGRRRRHFGGRWDGRHFQHIRSLIHTSYWNGRWAWSVVAVGNGLLPPACPLSLTV